MYNHPVYKAIISASTTFDSGGIVKLKNVLFSTCCSVEVTKIAYARQRDLLCTYCRAWLSTDLVVNFWCKRSRSFIKNPIPKTVGKKVQLMAAVEL